MSECLDLLLIECDKFALHVFHAVWNKLQTEQLRNNLPEDHILIYMDFAQNFLNRQDREIQSAYYDAVSVTLHGMVMFYNCPTTHCDAVRCDRIMHVYKDRNDEKKSRHDSFLPRLALEHSLERLVQKGVNIKRVLVVSDNCAGQYKSRRPFCDVARQPVQVTQCYFGDKHGKSFVDGFFWHTHICHEKLHSQKISNRLLASDTSAQCS